MTFRHTKLEDSTVMRSLEKLAHQKGWVQPELKKTANKQLSLSSTDSLVEHINSKG